jgi:DNA-binding Lrp family transcriptional regulator
VGIERGSGMSITGMDETTFKILKAVAADFGSGVSIHRLTERINERDPPAYYKNVYDRVKEMERSGLLTLERSGNSCIIKLNMGNYALMDMLTQMELGKKKKLLEANAELRMLFLEMETYFRQDFLLLDSLSIIRPERHMRLNRAEFLFVLKEKAEDLVWSESSSMHAVMAGLQKMHGIKLDYLIVTESEFFGLLKERGRNPLKEMIPCQTALIYPENYWMKIRKARENGISIENEEAEETNPAKIREEDMVYNLGRFGYKEFGTEIKQGRDICIELIIASILLKGDARRAKAIPELIEKSMHGKRQAYFNLLIFLCMKYGQAGELLELLKRGGGSWKDSGKAVKILEMTGGGHHENPKG